MTTVSIPSFVDLKWKLYTCRTGFDWRIFYVSSEWSGLTDISSSTFGSHHFSSDSIEICWFFISVIIFHDQAFSSLVKFLQKITRNTQTLVTFLQTLDSFLCSVSSFYVCTFCLWHNTLYRSLIFSVKIKKTNSAVVVFSLKLHMTRRVQVCRVVFGFCMTCDRCHRVWDFSIFLESWNHRSVKFSEDKGQ